ncbi:MAG: hypothetical protein AAGJ46_06505 [Planctomycetota bacterium]
MLSSVTTTLTALALTASAPQSLQWQADYGKALEQTRSDERPLLVVIDTPAADAEKGLEKALSATDKKLLSNYDLCRVNADTKYGKAVAEVFKAETLPYMAIIDKSGSIILHSQAGDMSADALASTLAKYKSGSRQVRVTVAKPVISSAPVESGVYLEAAPAQATPIYHKPMPTYYAPQSDCPNCRNGW